MTDANDQQAPPTGKQLAYLKTLAELTGQTFTWPRTSAQASREIVRLKRIPTSTRTARAIEEHDDRTARETAEDAAAIHGFEIVGYGSNCRWSH